MFGNSGGMNGGGAGDGGAREGYQTPGGGRSHHEAQQEERFVEGDLFGSTKRPSFRAADPPAGLPPRATYYDGAGAGDVGGNSFRNGIRSGVAGSAGGMGGYAQTPIAQPSPFARAPTPTGAFFSAATATPTNAFFSAAAAGGAAPGSAYRGARYSQVSPATRVRPTSDQRQSLGGGGGGEAALVPVEANGAGRGQNVTDDDDDDDDMPTRSLADDPDIRDEGADAVAAAEGLRYRRGGGAGGGDARGGLRVGGLTVGGFHAEQPDTQRATWVMVWGVPPGSANEVLTRFLQFGHVEEQRGQPGSNWLYIKYATRLQAEKALAAGHGSRLTDTVMLGVQRVPDDETWRALREGRIPPLHAAPPVLARSLPGRAANGDMMEIDDADLLGAPPQRPRGDKSLCGRVMALFGFY